MINKKKEIRKLKRQRAMLVVEDEEGLIGLTNGTFTSKNMEVAIDDIPIKFDDVGHIELSETRCMNCNRSFWVIKDNDPISCPFCHSKTLELADNNLSLEIKIGIVEKSSIDDDGLHMIMRIENEEIFVDAPLNTYEKRDYKKGTIIEIKAKESGTIAGEWEFGDLGILPLFIAEKVSIKRF